MANLLYWRRKAPGREVTFVPFSGHPFLNLTNIVWLDVKKESYLLLVISFTFSRHLFTSFTPSVNHHLLLIFLPFSGHVLPSPGHLFTTFSSSNHLFTIFWSAFYPLRLVIFSPFSRLLLIFLSFSGQFFYHLLVIFSPLFRLLLIFLPFSGQPIYHLLVTLSPFSRLLPIFLPFSGQLFTICAWSSFLHVPASTCHEVRFSPTGKREFSWSGQTRPEGPELVSQPAVWSTPELVRANRTEGTKTKGAAATAARAGCLPTSGLWPPTSCAHRLVLDTGVDSKANPGDTGPRHFVCSPASPGWGRC